MARPTQEKTKSPRASRVKSGIRALWLAACLLVVVTPRSLAEITLVSRLSDANAFAQAANGVDAPAPRTQVDFLPASLANTAFVTGEAGQAGANSTGNSSIVVDNSIGTLRVEGDGTAGATATLQGAVGLTTAKVIVVNFTLTDRTYTYLLTGQLSANRFAGFVSTPAATAKLAKGNATIFEVVADLPPAVTLSETGTLAPGNYTLSIEVRASVQGDFGSTSLCNSSANFDFALGPVLTPTPTPTPTPFGNTCGWSSAPAYPVETFAGGITSLGGYIYSFGGATSAALTKAYKFDGVSWTAIAPLPYPEAFPSAVTDGTNIYLVGGEVHKYDPVANTYTELARYNVQTAVHRSVYLGGKIYKMCGMVPGSPFPPGTDALEIYDIATDTWTPGAPVPYVASRVTAFTFGNYVYIAGGMLAPPSPASNAYRYDPSTNAWDNSIPFLPEARGDGTAAIYGNGVVLAGGATTHSFASDAALFWDSASNQWLNLPAMLTPRWDGIGAVLNGSFYYIGGRADGTSSGTTTNQKLSCTSLPTPTPTPAPPAQATNLSTRMLVQTGDNIGIGGFIITGFVPKHVLLRAVGPTLSQFGIPNPLADPVLELHGPPGFATIINDNCVPPQIIGPPPLCQPGSLDAIIDATLDPGAYTAVVRGKNNTSGVALVEVYDLNQSVGSKLANISTRAFVGTADNILIAGFVLGGNSGHTRIVVRGIGPSLAGFGVPNPLADPTLELRDNNGALLRANNDWQDNAAPPGPDPELIAAGLAPTTNLESAIVATLPPGLYTALLAGSNNETGVGVVEVYDRGAP